MGLSTEFRRTLLGQAPEPRVPRPTTTKKRNDAQNRATDSIVSIPVPQGYAGGWIFRRDAIKSARARRRCGAPIVPACVPNGKGSISSSFVTTHELMSPIHCSVSDVLHNCATTLSVISEFWLVGFVCWCNISTSSTSSLTKTTHQGQDLAGVVKDAALVVHSGHVDAFRIARNQHRLLRVDLRKKSETRHCGRRRRRGPKKMPERTGSIMRSSVMKSRSRSWNPGAKHSGSTAMKHWPRSALRFVSFQLRMLGPYVAPANTKKNTQNQ